MASTKKKHKQSRPWVRTISVARHVAGPRRTSTATCLVEALQTTFLKDWSIEFGDVVARLHGLLPHPDCLDRPRAQGPPRRQREASTASSAETPRIAASWPGGHTAGCCRKRAAKREKCRGSYRQAESQPDGDDQRGLPARHRAHLARGGADEPKSASSRPRCIAIIVSVFTTAIDVKAKMRMTKSGVSQRLASRSASAAVVKEARSLTRSPGYRGARARRRLATAVGVPVGRGSFPAAGWSDVCYELGAEQRFAERQSRV